jgi:hypothetical protein
MRKLKASIKCMQTRAESQDKVKTRRSRQGQYEVKTRRSIRGQDTTTKTAINTRSRHEQKTKKKELVRTWETNIYTHCLHSQSCCFFACLSFFFYHDNFPAEFFCVGNQSRSAIARSDMDRASASHRGLCPDAQQKWSRDHGREHGDRQVESVLCLAASGVGAGVHDDCAAVDSSIVVAAPVVKATHLLDQLDKTCPCFYLHVYHGCLYLAWTTKMSGNSKTFSCHSQFCRS